MTNQLLDIGDRIVIVMPSHRMGVDRIYDFVIVETILDGKYVIAPFTDKASEAQDLWENPWRRFTTSRRGFKVGTGESARTYPFHIETSEVK
jgi:hypothetical protein